MKNSTRLAALLVLLLAITGSLAASVALNRSHAIAPKPHARPFALSVPPAADAMWLAGIRGQ